MGFNKNGATAKPAAAGSAPAAVAAPVKQDSGTSAAIKRLKSAKSAEKAAAVGAQVKRFIQNDPNDVARGKTRCQGYCSALTSPALAGMQFETKEDLHDLLVYFADQCVKYSFQD